MKFCGNFRCGKGRELEQSTPQVGSTVTVLRSNISADAPRATTLQNTAADNLAQRIKRAATGPDPSLLFVSNGQHCVEVSMQNNDTRTPRQLALPWQRSCLSVYRGGLLYTLFTQSFFLFGVSNPPTCKWCWDHLFNLPTPDVVSSSIALCLSMLVSFLFAYLLKRHCGLRHLTENVIVKTSTIFVYLRQYILYLGWLWKRVVRKPETPKLVFGPGNSWLHKRGRNPFALLCLSLLLLKKICLYPPVAIHF